MARERMIEIDGQRYWLVAYRNGWRADPAYYTRGFDERGRAVLTEDCHILYDQSKPTPDEALDAAEKVLKGRSGGDGA